MPIGDDNDVQPARLPPPSPPPSSLSSTPAAGAPDMSRLPTNLLRDALAAVLHPSTPSPFQLVFSSHPAWPRPPLSSSSATAAAPALSKRELRISCLDSSFNPPTRAHQALATAAYPGPAGQAQGEAGDYDAHLLLLSVKNVDKVLKTGDADYEQRLQMIHLLAQDILAASQSPSAPASWRNVAIGLLSEPAFIHKDRVVRQWLRDGGRAAQDVKLCWLVGTDTVERFFDQKYYPEPLATCLPPFFDPPASTGSPPSELVHFARPAAAPPAVSSTKAPTPLYEATIASLGLPPGAIRIGRTRGEDDWGQVSSTAVRKDIAQGGGSWRGTTGAAIAAFVEQQGLYR